MLLTFHLTIFQVHYYHVILSLYPNKTTKTISKQCTLSWLLSTHIQYTCTYVNVITLNMCSRSCCRSKELTHLITCMCVSMCVCMCVGEGGGGDCNFYKKNWWTCTGYATHSIIKDSNNSISMPHKGRTINTHLVRILTRQ